MIRPKGPHRNLKGCKGKKGKGKGEGKKHHGGPKHCMFKFLFPLIFGLWGFLNMVGYYLHFGGFYCATAQFHKISKTSKTSKKADKKKGKKGAKKFEKLEESKESDPEISEEAF